MAYGKPQGPPKPGKLGVITDPLMNKNIGIDNKILMLIDDRVSLAREMDFKLGEQVEYKQLTQGIDKGKINFIKRAEGSAPPKQQAAPEKPAPTPVSHLPPDTQDIQAEYVGKDGVHIVLKDCMGDEQKYRGDLEVMKLLAKADGPVQPGKKFKIRMVKQGEEWLVTRIGPFDDTFGEKPFRTAKEILQQNIDEKKAEVAQVDAALAQINKENEQADARAKEHEEYIKSLTGAEKTMPAPEPTAAPEKSPQNNNTAARQALYKEVSEALVSENSDLPATGGVEIGVHVNLGNYSSFDLKVTGINGDHARQLLAQEAAPTIPLVKGIIKDASKGY
jgi:hypothetical protein